MTGTYFTISRRSLVLPRMKPVAPAKHELMLAIPLAVVSFILFNNHRPIGPIDTIGEAAAMTLAWVLSLNAVLDHRRMSPPAKLVAMAWFPLLTAYWTYVLYDAFTTRGWADR